MSKPKVEKSEAEWRAQLTPTQYKVLREKGTEPAFSGEYWDHHADGTYTCRACGEPLFQSETKFDSGCGWPSFFAPLEEGRIDEHEDRSHLMLRTEVTCAKCGGHLGHVFPDGPAPTGLRYCINSASIAFDEGGASEEKPKK
jgi:peptide-methionine (R)-S-oxide reductase